MNKKNKFLSPVRRETSNGISGANGVKNIFRFLPKDYLKSLGRKIMTAVILTVTVMITAGLAIWALAAFTEPAVGPAASDQDYAQNILGANNANNAFDSSLVTASSTGSLIERLQYIWDNRASFMANVTNLDATVSSRLAAASYVTERGTDSAALASDYTAARATKIDNLDATVSSRLAAASYVTERGTDSAALASDYTAARATKIDNLDTTISSRALDSEIGNATDAASISTTLFAGQQYIADNMPRSGPTIIYVTTATHNGAFGGRSGLDTFCKDYKPTVLTCSNIHAFISVSSTDEIRDMPAKYGYDYTQPVWWFKSSGDGLGTQVGTTWADILDSSIISSKDVGTGYAGSFWTGSHTLGDVADSTCDSWYSANNYYGNIGTGTATTGAWLYAGVETCWTSYFLLCACQ